MTNTRKGDFIMSKKIKPFNVDADNDDDNRAGGKPTASSKKPKRSTNSVSGDKSATKPSNSNVDKDTKPNNSKGDKNMSKNSNINPFNPDEDDDSQNQNGGNQGKPSGKQKAIIQMSQMPQQNEVDPTDFLIDYKELAQNNKLDHAQFRDNEVNALLSILNTIKHPNALLIGEAGVGKTQIVEELALQIEDENSSARSVLGADAHIYELPISLITGGSSLAGELEKRLNAIIDFAKDEENHAIIFIDEIHQLYTNHGSQAETISQTLKPALARGDMHVIGATTTNESRELKQDPAFNRRFTSITVRELTNEQTLAVLNAQLPKYNAKHNLATDEKMMPVVLEMANKYLTDSSRPDTALTLLDQASSLIDIRQKQNNLSHSSLTETHINDAVMQLLNTKAPKLDAKKLTKTLQAKIFGQDYAVEKMIDSLKRYALGLKFDNKPTSFLLAGPTGTGKSEIAKQISQSLFNEPNSLITLNMTEYTNESSINRLLGSDTGYVGSTSHEARPLDGLRRNPFQVVLLDEFEKCHPTVQRTFMQALDEGFIRDHSNRVIDFSKAVIIATTNAGAEELQSSASIGFSNHAQSVTDLNDSHAITEILKKSYPIELLNRFQTVISFNTLSKADYKQILKVMFNQLAPQIEKQVHLRFSINHLDLDVDYDFIDALADKSYEPAYNGRPARRSITNLLEDSLIANQNQYQVEIIKQSK